MNLSDELEVVPNEALSASGVSTYHVVEDESQASALGQGSEDDLGDSSEDSDGGKNEDQFIADVVAEALKKAEEEETKPEKAKNDRVHMLKSQRSSASFLLQQARSTDSLLDYDEVLEVMDESGEKVKKKFTDMVLEDVARFAGGFHPVTVVVDSLSYVVKTEAVDEGVPTVGKALKSVLGIHKRIFERQPTVEATVLRDVSFVVRPGQSMLVLGPPRCGKSTLLQILANRRRHGTVSGNLYMDNVPLYGPQQPKNWHRQVVYVTQADDHLERLTVRETFEFALKCLSDERMPEWKRRESLDLLMKMLGLEHQANTLVGGELLRGVSGGERKRVTCGVEFARTPELVLMDEPTCGLDSTTSLSVIGRVNLAAKALNIPVIVALQQPSFELFCQFDLLLLMDKGRVAYFGETTDALNFFENLGFVCPVEENPADFLPTVLHSPELYYQSTDEEKPMPRAREIVQAYRRSNFFAKIEQDINALIPEDDYIADTTAGDYSDDESAQPLKSNRHRLRGSRRRDIVRPSYTAKAHKYPLSLPMQTWALVKRGFLQNKNDPSNVFTRLFSALIMGVLLGTFFFQLGDGLTDTQNKGGLTFFMVTFVCLNAMGSAVPLIFQERNVFVAQRSAKYFSTFPYWCAAILVEMPIGLAESVVFGSIVYWIAGLNSDPGRFFFFLLILFVASQAVSAFTRFCAVISRELEVAESIAGAGVGVLLIYSGFMIQPDRLLQPLLGLVYISPMFYASNAVLINELSGTVVDCKESELVPYAEDPRLNMTYEMGGYGGTQICPLPTGEAILDSMGAETDEYWKYIYVAVLLAMALLFQIASFFGLKYIHHDTSASRNPVEQSRLTVDSVVDLPSVGAAVKISSSTSNQIEMHDLSSVNKDHDALDHELKVESNDFAVPLEEAFKTSGGSLPALDPNAGAYLTFKDLCYSVSIRKGRRKRRKQLLHNVSGMCRPGMLLALMGPSGAGKSTLLDVLAERKTGGRTTGSIMFNGNPRDASFQQMTAYVEQNDTHLPTQTVREAIEFSACTRTQMSRTEREDAVNRTLRTLDLVGIQDLMIGGGSLGDILSSEQKKRVTIGVELVTQPRLLFLDEPTSGLDTVGAFKVMSLVKRIANSGVSVICTIHQPSQSVFSLFTDLLLLRRGGHALFVGHLGESHANMFRYFRKLGHKCPHHKNPADFILDISLTSSPEDDTTESAPNASDSEDSGDEVMMDDNLEASAGILSSSLPLSTSIDASVNPEDVVLGDQLVQHWIESEERAAMLEEIDQGICPDNIQVENYHGRRYAVNYFTQFRLVWARARLSHWRRPSVVAVRIGISLFMAALLGITFWQIEDDPVGAGERSSLLYFCCLLGVMNSFSVLAALHEERPAYYRERAALCYSSAVYILSFILAQLPYQLLGALIVIVPVYFMAGLKLTALAFFQFALIYIASTLASTAFCQAAMSLTKSLQIATAVVSAIITLFAITAGFILPKADMPKPYLGVYYINYLSYALEAFIINEFEGLDIGCPDNDFAYPIPVDTVNGTQIQYYCPLENGDQYIDGLGLNADMFWADLAIVAAFWLAFEFVSWIGVRFVVAIRR